MNSCLSQRHQCESEHNRLRILDFHYYCRAHFVYSPHPCCFHYSISTDVFFVLPQFQSLFSLLCQVPIVCQREGVHEALFHASRSTEILFLTALSELHQGCATCSHHSQNGWVLSGRDTSPRRLSSMLVFNRRN